jgi:hypothetical protein
VVLADSRYNNFRVSCRLLCFFVSRVFSAKAAVFAEFQLIRRRPLVLGRRVVSLFAVRTG